jgi:hypothetical protein
MRKNSYRRYRRREQGQTIILVAISLVSLLAMAALAIDIVTLYAARSEVQRSADAAALAGAQAIADSGFTSLQPTDTNYLTAANLARRMANTAIDAMVTTAAINPVAGQLPTKSGAPTFDFATHPGSFQVTVTLQRDNIPTFFSRIWSRNAPSAKANATAEVYNPSNLPTMTPIAPRNVKPWLMANANPFTGGTPFITASGGVPAGLIGRQFDLTADCPNASLTCSPIPRNPPTYTPSVPFNRVDYVPALASTNPKNVCSSSCAGGNAFEQSIECFNADAYAVMACGGGTTSATWDNTYNPTGPNGFSASGAECLIHASAAGPNLGQDTLDMSPWPGNPMKITAQSGLQSGNLVATSDSIVTIPIIDNTSPLTPPSGPVTIVGYMRVFINWVEDGSVVGTNAGDINITVLNIAGCSSTNNGANPVVGGSGSLPIPVRLITPP